MKVTCGSCFRALVVEDWLADNVARCPKCNEVIRIPAKGSPDGANAAVLTVDEATELLRQRAAAEPKNAGQAGAPGEPPQPTGPKTEPLPAFLKQASASIHEEPEHRKTRPLPKPVGRGSPGLEPAVAPPPAPTMEAAPLPPVERGYSAFRANPLTPLVPVAFVVGLLVGAACGWMIARAGRNDGPAPQKTTTPPVETSSVIGTTTDPVGTTPTVATTTATTTAQPPTNPNHDNQQQRPEMKKDVWLTEQPRDARTIIDGPVQVARRVAAVGGRFPQANLCYPAPLGQVYIDVKLKLKKAAGEPVSFRLGGQDADCWLLAQDGKTFDPMGRASAEMSAPADGDATIALDAEHESADVELRFRVPSDLKPPVRVAFSGSQFAELPADGLSEPDPLRDRTPEGTRWDRVRIQAPAQDHRSQPILAALAGAGEEHRLTISGQGDGYEVTIDKAGVSGTFRKSSRPGRLEGSFKLADNEAKATIRIFDACRTLLIYFGDEPGTQLAYQRHESKVDWE